MNDATQRIIRELIAQKKEACKQRDEAIKLLRILMKAVEKQDSKAVKAINEECKQLLERI